MKTKLNVMTDYTKRAHEISLNKNLVYDVLKMFQKSEPLRVKGSSIHRQSGKTYKLKDYYTIPGYRVLGQTVLVCVSETALVRLWGKRRAFVFLIKFSSWEIYQVIINKPNIWIIE